MYGAPGIVQTEHMPEESIWRKCIASANPWLKTLLLTLPKYDKQYTVYLIGRLSVVTYASSRIACLDQSITDQSLYFTPVNSINGTTQASEKSYKTQTDNVLSLLKHITHQGWLDIRTDGPAGLLGC